MQAITTPTAVDAATTARPGPGQSPLWGWRGDEDPKLKVNPEDESW